MITQLIFSLKLLVLTSKPKPDLEPENAALGQQVTILQRKLRGRVQLTNGDRLFFVLLYRLFPSILKAMSIIQPETGGALASDRLSALLALEIEKSGRPAADLRWVAGLDPAHEPREHALGGAAHSWRVAQTWVHGGAVDGGKIHGQEGSRPLRSKLEHVPAQSHAAHRGDRFVCGPDPWLSP